jgi:hypothetical protein
MRIEPMKRHLAPALFSLSLCAVMGGVRVAGAQTVDAPLQPVGDSVMATVQAPIVLVEPAAAMAAAASPGAPLLVAPTGVRPGVTMFDVQTGAPAAAPAMVEWKMPTSRALMIGGAATAIIGLAAVGGDTGAIIALSGTAVAVYGLYLHYNR